MQTTDQANQSEHEFLSFCEKIKADEAPWNTLHVGYSEVFDRSSLLKNLAAAGPYIQKKRAEAMQTFTAINNQAKDLKTEAVSYIFTDNDIILFARQKDSDVAERFEVLRTQTRLALPPQIPVELLHTDDDLGKLIRLGNNKVETSRCMRAMHIVAEANPKRETLAIRRQGRKVPLVMLVEDDRFTAAYTTELLAKDYEVFHVRSGEEAVEYYLDYAPDAVFIDLHLPGICGNAVLQLLNALDPQAYCVMLSVDSSQTAVIEAAQTGANSYLRKPYNKERLLWSVRQSPHILRPVVQLGVVGQPAE